MTDRVRGSGRCSKATLRERGQLTHDFAVGISIFLLTAAFVLSFVPSVTTPFATGITEVEQERSQTVGRLLVGNLSASDGSTVLNVSRTNAFFDRSWGDGELQQRFGLPSTTRVNVTFRQPSGDGDIVPELTTGDSYRGQAGATTVRLVSYNDQIYRLEVRVW